MSIEKNIIQEETTSGDVAPFTKPVDTKVDKRPSFKDFFKKKKKEDEDSAIKNQDD